MLNSIIGEATAKEIGDEGIDCSDKVSVLKQKMELLGIKCNDSCIPGKYSHLLCPKVITFQFHYNLAF